jgi:hypothetical protein
LFEIAAAAGIEVEIGLDVGDAGIKIFCWLLTEGLLVRI